MSTPSDAYFASLPPTPQGFVIGMREHGYQFFGVRMISVIRLGELSAAPIRVRVSNKPN